MHINIIIKKQLKCLELYNTIQFCMTNKMYHLPFLLYINGLYLFLLFL